jgi:hypothetical protein
LETEVNEPRSEAWVKAQVKKIFAEFGVDQPYMPAAGIGRQGAADFIESMFGRYLAVETKKRGNKQTRLQKEFRDGVVERGGIYLLIYEDNIDDVRTVLQTLKLRTPPWY